MVSVSVDPKEIQQFSKDSDRWWDEKGPFAPLHRLNPTRLSYIKSQICKHYELDDKSFSPFKGLKVLDVGCGGGLACEPMARLGGTVTGIDADEQAISVAKAHAETAGLKITYKNTTTEELTSKNVILTKRQRVEGSQVSEGDPSTTGANAPSAQDDKGLYDVILALEIIEHVTDIQDFVKSCAKLLKPGGLIIFSTLNRTAKSFALGIVAAEYILRWVPRGTHNWKKFVKPSELSRTMRQADLTPQDITGLIYNPVTSVFSLSDSDIYVNYFMTARH